MADVRDAPICSLCDLPVSLKTPGWNRLRRDDGGFDHTYCGLGISSLQLAETRREAEAERAHQRGLKQREHRDVVAASRRQGLIL